MQAIYSLYVHKYSTGSSGFCLSLSIDNSPLRIIQFSYVQVGFRTS